MNHEIKFMIKFGDVVYNRENGLYNHILLSWDDSIRIYTIVSITGGKIEGRFYSIRTGIR